jgi:hypothetical protein
MATLTIKYNTKDIVLPKLPDAITFMKGVETDVEEILSETEMKAIEKSRKSGILYDMDKLKEKLKS